MTAAQPVEPAHPTSLAGRVVVVAGGGSALGQTVAERLGAAGAVVEACDASPQPLETLTARVEAVGAEVTTAVVDLMDEAATTAWAQDVVARRGRVDGLLHLVGGWRGGVPLVEADLADWDWLQGRLVRTLQHTSRAFHPALSAGDAGRLVIVSATQASRPTQRNASYAAAKAAAEAWTQAVAHSWKDSEGAAAVVLVVTGLLTPAMRAEKPEASFSSLTHVDDVAGTIAGLWDRPGTELNGERLWLTP